MKRFLAFAATVGTMGLALGFTATQAAAAPGSAPAASTQASKPSGKNYTCSNQGGGPNHKVTCIGTVNGNNVTVNVGDVNVLSNNNLTLLQNVLNDVTVQVANLDVDTQIKQIEASVLTFYVSKLLIPITVDKIQVCVAVKCG
ncbi:hypothetical protein QLQ12_29310 [Actinoplanes sp. NEAU-A12]|uniref:Preprotein translocase subunit TatB n=1 Tax=Actinoplanes sandaracinus TaxID=3045177 RepID=A0ABT6WSV0_9ACTN|nr:hypothetical protein [Actinoplanes sandaracinus]MDI6102725.1 hypothetical protein [Actinoplanes sandaracinus]